MGKRITYVAIQATVEGQASYAHIHEIIKGLKLRGFEVRLYEPQHRNRARGYVERFIGFFSTQFSAIRGVIWADVIYIRSHFAALPIAVFCKLIGKPQIHEVNGPYEDLFVAFPWTRRFARFFVWLTRSGLQQADVLITVTPGLAKWLEGVVRNREIHVIPNGANCELFRPDQELKVVVQQPYALFFGVLAEWQGVDTLLKAVDSEFWPQAVQLVIAGDGACRQQVEDAVRVSNRIQYLGRRSYSEMPGLIANALVSLIPKNSKGDRKTTGLSPLKLYETLACGIPAVVTDFPGQADLIRDEDCGVVIPEQNPDALAMAVKTIFESPEERKAMGARARDAIVRSHSWEERAEVTSKIIEKCMPGFRRRNDT